MSIDDVIHNHCHEGALFQIEPPLLGDSVTRSLYVTSDINGQLGGPWNDEWDETAWGMARAVMDTFVSGRLLSIGKRKPQYHMTHLEPLKDGVWDMRATKPPPGIRILGRFVRQNFFVALDWEYRSLLDDVFQWKRVTRNCERLWRYYFHTYQPLLSENPHDYLTHIFIG